MNYRLSKFARTIIIINIIITLVVASYHCLSIYRMHESYGIIHDFMEENKVIQDTAIRYLEKQGVELFINRELTTAFGLFASTLTLVLLYFFAKTNGFFAVFFAALSSLFTSFIGGLLLFYLIFSDKSEVTHRNNVHSLKNEWERYIHKKVETIDTNKQ